LTIKDKKRLWELRERRSFLNEDEKEMLRNLECIADGKSVDKSALLREKIRNSGEVKPDEVCPELTKLLAELKNFTPKYFEDQVKKVVTESAEKRDKILTPARYCKTISQLNTIHFVFQQTAAEQQEDEITASKSIRFASCETNGCEGVFCLICEISLQKNQVNDHECKMSAVTQLYHEVINALAEASTRRCPQCGTAGQKDLACTHMTCDKCKTKWCYLCQKSESDLGDFAAHNDWDLNSGESSPNCPMYLQQKYGDIRPPDEIVMDGSPEKALIKFHIELQKRVIAKMEKEKDSKIWEEMIHCYFPDGMFQEVEEVKEQ
jgi:hypothetical protein